ncbi:hypothetical protein [Niabella beijingensis]|uniref:hypothetical protein n=1 Tax=Niabella beijingensis TaxID=2872700 RepID=UPI001CBB72BF|nr:hypothetical protein [Niabella beijingensis]MBZ4191994.1 hypothetical protein [Niabella beijingensis]
MLNKDSTFGYSFQGDLEYDTAAGYYRILNKQVILHPTQVTSDLLPENTGAGESKADNRTVKKTHYFLIGHHRLFSINEKGVRMKRRLGYFKRRKFLLFGPHWFNKHYYLKRISN